LPSWGRWGAQDERGALNLLGPDDVISAAREIRTGQILSLAAPIAGGKGYGLVGRANPAHFMVRDGGDYAAGRPERAGFGFADDVLSVPTHGVTHLDALAHIWRGGQMYNGFSANSVTSRGAARLGIENVSPIITRGVFVDCAPGTARRPSEPVHLDELKSLLADASVELRAGDALLIRTGWMEAAADGQADATAWPGLDRDCGPWLADQDIVLAGADNPGVEAFPSSDPDCQVPMHVELLRGHGIYLAELMNLGELAAADRATFMFVVAPLPLVGGVGSPVVPIAVL